jgi:hypothetical protein
MEKIAMSQNKKLEKEIISNKGVQFPKKIYSTTYTILI